MEDENTQNDTTKEISPENAEENETTVQGAVSALNLTTDPISSVQEEEKRDYVVEKMPSVTEVPIADVSEEEKLEENEKIDQEEIQVDENKIDEKSVDISEPRKLEEYVSFSEPKTSDRLTSTKFSLTEQQFKDNQMKDRKSYVTSSLSDATSSKYIKRKSKIQDKNRDRMRQALGSVIEYHRQSMYSGEARLGRYMNSYKLESDNPFNPEKVEKILKEVLSEIMENMTYDKDNCPNQAKLATQLIRKKVKELEFDRYKIVVLVTIGEKNFGHILVTSSFLWDAEKDRFAYYSTENSHVFGIAQCFGIYYE